MKWYLRISEVDARGTRPFWFDDQMAPETVLYACGLTVLGAAVAGIVPALKLTGRKLESRLRETTTGGLRFGGVWTAVIVIQVAVTVAFPAAAFFVRRHVVKVQSLDVGFPAAEYVSVRLDLDRAASPEPNARAEFLARFRAIAQELERRLQAEPAVGGVTFTDRLPRTTHPDRWIEADEAEAAPPAAARVNIAAVRPNYFEVVRAPLLAGRAFNAGDLRPDARVIIVNTSFVERVLGGRNAVGRRVRYLPADPKDGWAADKQPGPWHEIIGVVKDLGTIHDNPSDLAGFYHPLADNAFPVFLAAHVKGDPQTFAPRLRSVAAAVDPTLQLHDLMPLDKVGEGMWNESAVLMMAVCLLACIVPTRRALRVEPTEALRAE